MILTILKLIRERKVYTLKKNLIKKTIEKEKKEKKKKFIYLNINKKVSQCKSINRIIILIHKHFGKRV